MSNVVSICQSIPTVFTLQEADELIPLITKITSKSEKEVQKLLDNQRFLLISGAPTARITEIDAKIGKIMVEWGTKMTKLGLKALGSGFVGFNCGIGYWSWHQGETKIEWYHGYDESPLMRRKITRHDDDIK